MEEQLLFTQVHEALDIPTPPGAFERLRTELTKKPVRRRAWPVFEMRTSSMGFRLAAGLAVVAIAVAAAAAVLAIHNSTNNVSPAGPRMSIAAYQKIVADDYAFARASSSGQCDIGVHTGCAADATSGIPAAQKWINDLSRPDIPDRFVVINAEMKQHLLQNLPAQRDLLAAANNHDGPGMDRAFEVAVYAGEWTTTVTPGIAASKQVSASVYIHQVKVLKQSIESCSNCTLLTAPDARSCATNHGVPCLVMFDNVAFDFATYAMTLVQYAAPDSLLAKDAGLQNDLAEADAVLLTMRLAVAANDQAGINSGIDQLIRISARVDQDAKAITG